MIFNFSKKVFKEFFSFSRSELRGVALLAVLLIVLISFRVYIGYKNDKLTFEIVEKIQPAKMKDVMTYDIKKDINEERIKLLKEFDPNTIDYNGLIEMGLDKKISQHIINYRKKGGKFYTASDLLKIYGIDSSVFLELLPNINIPATVKNIKKAPEFRIDLNTADTSDLKKIPGIGTVLSKRIIKYRSMLGGFYIPSQLAEVYGISDSLFATFSKYVHVDTTNIRHININTCKQEELESHPYLTKYQAKSIQSYRKLSGPISNKKLLLDNFILSEETYLKIAPYLTLN